MLTTKKEQAFIDDCIKILDRAAPYVAVNKSKVVLFSGKAQSGKDSSANILKNLLEGNGSRVLRLNYADYLKFIAEKYLGWNGLKDEHGRELLQFIGTEVVRGKDELFWVRNVIDLVDMFSNDYDYVIIGDCRFQNEIDEWKVRGYETVTIRVERTNFESELTDKQKGHESENALNSYPFDSYIRANDLTELRQQVIKNVMPFMI